MSGIIAGLLQDIRNELRRQSTMKIEQQSNESQKNVRILVRSTDRLPNDIHCDGKIRIDRICGEFQVNEYKGQVGKVIEIEPLNDEFCAVMLAMEE